MSGRTAFTQTQEIAVRAALRHFPARDRLFVLMGLHLGFRVHELLSVTIGQVWDGAAVRSRLLMPRSRMKGGAGVGRRAVSSRVVPLHPLVAAAIADYLEQRTPVGAALELSAPLFLSRQGGRAMGRLQANRVLAAVIARAGISEAGVWGSHSLRKTFAQRIYSRSGHDIDLTRVALGHRHITTTQRYLSTSDEVAGAAILALGPEPLSSAA